MFMWISRSRLLLLIPALAVFLLCLSTISTEAAMVWNDAAHVDTLGKAYDVVVEGDLAFVAAGRGGVRIIDISEPLAPVELGFNDTPMDGRGLAVVGDMAYLAAGNEGLWIFNLSVLSAPTVMGRFDTPGFAEDVTVTDGLAYVSDGLRGLRIVNVSDPANPTPEGEFDTPGYCYESIVKEDLAFLAIGQSGLSILNISQPSNISYVGGFGEACGCSDLTQFRGLRIIHELVYIADAADLMKVYDLSNLTNVTFMAEAELAGLANDIVLSSGGGLAYLAIDREGVAIVNLTDPGNPVILRTIQVEGMAHGVAVSPDGTIIVAAGNSGLRMVLELVDGDGDGLGDAIDAYPDDPAASLDSDGDGHPDEWNEGMTETDSTTGLRLDIYPDDPERWDDVDEEDSPGPGMLLMVLLVAVGMGRRRDSSGRSGPGWLCRRRPRPRR